MEQLFETSVCVKSGDVHATLREIRTPHDASGFLTDWPAAKRTTPAYRDAAIACDAAAKGESPADQARLAFVDFARDMEILVRC